MADGLSYYDGGPGVCRGIRVIDVVYVVLGNRAVSSFHAVRLADEHYIYVVMF
jgi:hypothetical protein